MANPGEGKKRDGSLVLGISIIFYLCREKIFWGKDGKM